jgi:chromosome segregation ATPase
MSERPIYGLTRCTVGGSETIWFCCDDGTVRSCNALGVLQPLRLVGHRGAVLSICYDESTGYLWTGGADGAVKTWSFSRVGDEFEVSCISTNVDHQSGVVQLSRHDGECRVWSLSQEGRCILYHATRLRPEQYLHPNGRGGTSTRSASVDFGSIKSICAVRQQYVWKVWVCGAEGIVRLFTTPCLAAPSKPADASDREKQLTEDARQSALRSTDLQGQVSLLTQRVEVLMANESSLKAANEDLERKGKDLKEALEGEILLLQEKLNHEAELKGKQQKEIEDLRQELRQRSDTEVHIRQARAEVTRYQAHLTDSEAALSKSRVECETLSNEVMELRERRNAIQLEFDNFRLSADRLAAESRHEVARRDAQIAELQLQAQSLKSQLVAEITRTPPASPPRAPMVLRLDLEDLAATELQSRHLLFSVENSCRSALAVAFGLLRTQQAESEEGVRRHRREMELVLAAKAIADRNLQESEQDSNLKLRSTTNQLKESSDRQRALEERIAQQNLQVEQLQRQLEMTRDRLKAAEETSAAQSSDFANRLQTLQKRLSESTSDKDRLQDVLAAQLDSATQSVKVQKAENDALRAKVAQLEALTATAEEATREAEAKVARSDKRSNRLEGELLERDKEMQTLTALLHQPKDDTQLKLLAEQVSRKSNELLSQTKELERLQRLVQQMESNLESERMKVADWEKAYRSASEKADKLAHAEESARNQNVLQEESHRSQQQMLQVQLDHFRRELKSMEEGKLVADAQLSKLNQAIQRSNEEKALLQEKAEIRIQLLSSEIDELKSSLSAATAAKQSLANSSASENDLLNQQLRSCRADLHRMEEERDRLRQLTEAAQDSAHHVQTMKQEIKALQASKADLELALASVEQRARTAEADRERSILEVSRLRSEQQTSTRMIEQLRREATEREGELHGLKSSQQVKDRDYFERMNEVESILTKCRADLSKKNLECEELREAKTLLEAENRRQMTIVQNEMSQMDAEVASLQRQIHEGAHNADRVILQGEVTELRHSIANLQRDLSTKRQEIRDQQLKLHQVETELLGKIRDEQQAAVTLKSEISGLQQSLRLKEDERLGAQRRTDELQKKLDNLAAESKSRYENELSILRGENDALSRENKRLTVESTELARQLESLVHDHKVAMRNEKTERDRAVEELTQQVNSLQRELRSKAQELSQAIKSAEDKEIEMISKHRTDHSTLHAQLEECRAALEMQKSNAKNQLAESNRVRLQLEERAQTAESLLLSERHNTEKQLQEYQHEIRLLQKESKNKAAELSLLRIIGEDVESDLTLRFRSERSALVTQNEQLRDQVAILQRDMKLRLDDIVRLQKELDEKEAVLALKWKDERIQLETRLQRLESDSLRLRDVSSIKDMELKDLAVNSERSKAQVAKAMAEKALLQAEAEDLREENTKLVSQLRSFRLEVDSLVKENQGERSLNASLHDKLRLLEEGHSADSSRLELSYRQSQFELEEALQAARSENRKLQQSKGILETVIDELRQQSKDIVAEKDRLAREVERLRSEFETCHDNLSATLRELHLVRETAAQRDSAVARAEALELELDQCRRKLRQIELGAQGEELERRDELHRLRQQQQQLATERARLAQELGDAQRALEAQRAETAPALSRASELESKVQQLVAELEQARRKINGLEDNIHQLQIFLQQSNGKRDIQYLERQVALVAQLIRRCKQAPENIDRADMAIADVLAYLRTAKLQEQSAVSPRPWAA